VKLLWWNFPRISERQLLNYQFFPVVKAWNPLFQFICSTIPQNSLSKFLRWKIPQNSPSNFYIVIYIEYSVVIVYVLEYFCRKILEKSLSKDWHQKIPVSVYMSQNLDFPLLLRLLADGRGRGLRRPRMVVHPGPPSGDVHGALHLPLGGQDAHAHRSPSHLYFEFFTATRTDFSSIINYVLWNNMYQHAYM